MRGLLIENRFLKTEKFQTLTQMFLRAAGALSISLDVLENTDVLVHIRGGAESSNYGKRPDFVLFWDKDILSARCLEHQGIPVYNSARCIALCDDKRKMHLALAGKGIPVPDTVLAPMAYSGIGFTDTRFLAQIEEMLGYPVVVKEAKGSFGDQVYLAGNREELERIVAACRTTEILFQRFVEHSRGRDIRLQVVGDRVVGSMLRHSERDFRANITAGGAMEAYAPTAEEIQLALDAARAVEADFAGVDLLFGEEGPLVCEVNSNAHFKNLMDCTGVDTAREILAYIRERTQ